MALIQCPECGKEISDKATACPNCGWPVPQGQTGDGNSMHEDGSQLARDGETAALVVDETKKSKRLIEIVLGIIAVAVTIIAVILISSALQERREKADAEATIAAEIAARDTYIENVRILKKKMLSSGNDTVEMSFLIRNVLLDLQIQEADALINETEYTEDPDVSLRALLNDTEYQKRLEKVIMDSTEITDLYKRVQSPSANLSNCTPLLADMYSSYLIMVDFVAEPPSDYAAIYDIFDEAMRAFAQTYIELDAIIPDAPVEDDSP